MTFAMQDKLPDDHPIKRGLVAFVPRQTGSFKTPSRPETSLPDQNSDPMQGAVDQIEAALKAKDAKFIAEMQQGNTASPSLGSTTPEKNDLN